MSKRPYVWSEDAGIEWAHKEPVRCIPVILNLATNHQAKANIAGKPTRHGSYDSSRAHHDVSFENSLSALLTWPYYPEY